MSYELFSISIPDGHSELGKLNDFLCTHRVVAVQKQVVERDGIPFFVFLVEYSPSKNASSSFVAQQQSKGAPVDYKTLLTAEQFERFLRLKDERAKIANELGVKLFVVFTNENLAEMARAYPKSLAELKNVPGIGEGRVEKYGLRMLNALEPKKDSSADEGTRDDANAEGSV